MIFLYKIQKKKVCEDMDSKQRFLEKKLKEADKKIEEQTKIIRELELRKDQYDSILENMSEMVERTDPNFYLLYVNKALLDFYGITREEMLGSDTMDLVVKEDHEKIYEMMSHVNAENPYYKYQYRVNIDGKIYWMESFGRGFYREDGSVIEYQDVSRDITHFKNVEKELNKAVKERTEELERLNSDLKELNVYLQSILSGISEGVVVINLDGSSEFLNYGPRDIWKSHSREIAEYFKKLLNAEKSNVLNWMFLKNKPFADVEMNYSSGKSNADFIVSGVPLTVAGGVVSRGILMLKPAKQVRKMVMRMSGLQADFRFQDIVTTSPALMDLISLAKQAATADCSVMIEGESGTGKELFAQSIHNASLRKNGPFVAVNCGAVPRELIASELFGYEEGSFTGAKKGGKPGKFELAEGGTLFLDEIGEMPMEQQVALLRVIQERRVMRVGGEREIPVDVRIISATNRNLRREVEESSFREDLYYRLNVIGIKIPPLRERKEDILPLFCSFWAKNAGKDAEAFLKLLQPEAADVLCRYDWPGNVRELQNAADRMMYLSGGGDITVQYLPKTITGMVEKNSVNASSFADVTPSAIRCESIRGLRNQKKENKLFEQRAELLAALDAAGGNVSKAAKNMGISRATFYRKLKLSEED